MDYNNNKVRGSLLNLLDGQPEPSPVLLHRKRSSVPDTHAIFEKQIETHKYEEAERKRKFLEKHRRDFSRESLVAPEKQVKKVGLQAREVTVEQIMEKVTKIKQDIVSKKRALSQQKITKTSQKPLGVIDCCAQALDSSAGFHRFLARHQEAVRAEEASHKRTQSTSARVIKNPQSVTDRAVNFLIKEIDKGPHLERTETAHKLYRDMKGEETPEVKERIKSIFSVKKSPAKSKSHQNQKVICNGTSIIVTRFQPLGQPQNKKSPSKQPRKEPLVETQHKYEIPFNQETQKKQRFLKKGSNITGMILQHIFKHADKKKVDTINFEKERFLEEYNQTLPEELYQWKDDIQRSLKILKGKVGTRKNDAGKPDKYGGFDMDDVIYLSDNKRHFIGKNLNDYYEEPDMVAHSPSAH